MTRYFHIHDLIGFFLNGYLCLSGNDEPVERLLEKHSFIFVYCSKFTNKYKMHLLIDKCMYIKIAVANL